MNKSNGQAAAQNDSLGKSGESILGNEEWKPNFSILWAVPSPWDSLIEAAASQLSDWESQCWDGADASQEVLGNREGAVKLLRALLATGKLADFAANPAKAEDYLSGRFKEMQ